MIINLNLGYIIILTVTLFLSGCNSRPGSVKTYAEPAVTGALVGSFLAHMNKSDRNKGAVIGGILGLVAGYGVDKQLNSYSSQKTELQNEILSAKSTNRLLYSKNKDIKQKNEKFNLTIQRITRENKSLRSQKSQMLKSLASDGKELNELQLKYRNMQSKLKNHLADSSSMDKDLLQEANHMKNQLASIILNIEKYKNDINKAKAII